MKRTFGLLFLSFMVAPAMARTLRCANVPSSSYLIAFETDDFVETADLELTVTRAGMMGAGDVVALAFTGKNRSGYSRYTGHTSNPSFAGASLWLNTSYVNDRNYFPGELTLRAPSAVPIPLLCTVTKR